MPQTNGAFLKTVWIKVSFRFTLNDLQLSYIMSKHALRSSAQKESKFGLNTSNDNKKMNAYKGNDTPNRMAGKNGEKQQEMDKIDEMFDMIKAVMKKLDTLEEIKQRIVCVERELIDVKNSIEFAHAEVKELRGGGKSQKIRRRK